MKTLVLLLLGLSRAFDLAPYEALNAYAAVLESKVEENIDVAVGCTCGGTGKIITGDNKEFPCQCGPNCPCKKKDVEKTELAKQLLFFTGPGCPPCAKIKTKSFPGLKESGWTFGEKGNIREATRTEFE